MLSSPRLAWDDDGSRKMNSRCSTMNCASSCVRREQQQKLDDVDTSDCYCYYYCTDYCLWWLSPEIATMLTSLTKCAPDCFQMTTKLINSNHQSANFVANVDKDCETMLLSSFDIDCGQLKVAMIHCSQSETKYQHCII